MVNPKFASKERVKMKVVIYGSTALFLALRQVQFVRCTGLDQG